MTQRSDAGEARSGGPTVSSQARYHRATALPDDKYFDNVIRFFFQSERNEYDFMHAKGITTKSAPFGNLDTPMITMKLVGGEYKPCIESSPR